MSALERALTLNPYVPVNAVPSPLGQRGEFVRLTTLVAQVGRSEAARSPEVKRLLSAITDMEE